MLSKGQLHRNGLILQNEDGNYDCIVLYKNKKTAEPFAILKKGIMTPQIHDKAVSYDGETKDANYNMKLLNITDDGSHLEIYISNATDMHADFIFQPKSLFYDIAEKCRLHCTKFLLRNNDPKMVTDCMLDNWNIACKWQSDAIHYLM